MYCVFGQRSTFYIQAAKCVESKSRKYSQNNNKTCLNLKKFDRLQNGFTSKMKRKIKAKRTKTHRNLINFFILTIWCLTVWYICYWFITLCIWYSSAILIISYIDYLIERTLCPSMAVWLKNNSTRLSDEKIENNIYEPYCIYRMNVS